MAINTALINEVDGYVFDLFKEKLPDDYVYHNYNHTYDVVQATQDIAEGVHLNDQDTELVLLSAWFHDTGYIKQKEGHELISAGIAKEYLEGKNYPKDCIDIVIECIKSTNINQKPNTLIEQVLRDADLAHLGSVDFFEKNDLYKLECYSNGDGTDKVNWLQSEIEFLKSHSYHTPYAQLLLNDQKLKNIIRLQKDLKKAQDKKEKKTKKPSPEDQIAALAKAEKKAKKDKTPERGIETMFRVTLRNHINLSAIADNKANIMLSINAIIISIVLSSILPNLVAMPHFIAPTGLLIGTCLTSIIFATLSTKPKVTKGKFTREDIMKRKSNLLFFGNFHDMELKDFEWGVSEMMQDRDFLYGSLIRDFYYLGIVLNKKYNYLRICYMCFMIGLIVSVLAFTYAIVTHKM